MKTSVGQLSEIEDISVTVVVSRIMVGYSAFTFGLDSRENFLIVAGALGGAFEALAVLELTST